MACKSCGTGGNQAMAPAGVNPEGFQQAQLSGQQFQPPKSSFWTGSKASNALFPLLTPQQQQLTSQAGQQASNLIGQGGGADYSGFEPIAQQARTQFQTDTVPSLAERFVSMGRDSRLGRSGYVGELGKAGGQLDQALAALKSQYGLQQQGLNNQRLGTLLSGGLGRQFESAYMPAQPGFLQNAGTALAGGAGLLGSLGLKSLFGL